MKVAPGIRMTTPGRLGDSNDTAAARQRLSHFPPHSVILQRTGVARRQQPHQGRPCLDPSIDLRAVARAPRICTPLPPKPVTLLMSSTSSTSGSINSASRYIARAGVSPLRASAASGRASERGPPSSTVWPRSLFQPPALTIHHLRAYSSDTLGHVVV
jgi:hypothetical protein